MNNFEEIKTNEENDANTHYPNGKYPLKGEVYYISAGSTGATGYEQWSNRYGIIVSSDWVNKTSQTVQVVYLTTKGKPKYPTYVDISLPWMHREAICGQIMTVDVSRLGRYKCYIRPEDMKKIDFAIRYGLGLGASRLKERR